MTDSEALEILKISLPFVASKEVNEAVEKAVEVLELQIEINNMALIQSYRKCVLGRDEMYSDSTLQNMSKAQLIGLLHTAQHNYSVLLETLDGRVKYYEKELAAMSDETKWGGLKMDESEAIARLRDHFEIHDDGRPTPFLDKAVNVAYKALEKQIPKKPIRKPNADWTWEEITCPACGKFVSLHEHHCKCGQKLDWSEV